MRAWTGGVVVTLVAATAPAAGLVATAARSEAKEGAATAPVYRKPFLVQGRASVGGYMDLEFKANEVGSTFDQHRFVPFIYAEVSDRVHVASEIEFEHGGAVAGDEETDGEIKIEFATLDFRVSEGLNFRGGVILSPLGRLNVLHDAPMLDLTDRPLVDGAIIPTTLSEAGLGVHGMLYPSEQVVVDYEAYLVNGFGAASVENGVLELREGRGSTKSDNNNARSVVGRIGVSPRLGTEVGVSVHTGAYDDAGDYNLTLAALDARFARGPVEVLGEAALATTEFTVDTTLTLTVADARAGGFYLEGRVHFLAGAVRALPMSVFTGVVRVDYVDRNREVDGHDAERLTFGINFRPTEETVIKNDLVLDRDRDTGVPDWSDTRTGYRLSLATYF